VIYASAEHRDRDGYRRVIDFRFSLDDPLSSLSLFSGPRFGFVTIPMTADRHVEHRLDASRGLSARKSASREVSISVCAVVMPSRGEEAKKDASAFSRAVHPKKARAAPLLSPYGPLLLGARRRPNRTCVLHVGGPKGTVTAAVEQTPHATISRSRTSLGREPQKTHTPRTEREYCVRDGCVPEGAVHFPRRSRPPRQLSPSVRCPVQSDLLVEKTLAEFVLCRLRLLGFPAAPTK